MAFTMSTRASFRRAGLIVGQGGVGLPEVEVVAAHEKHRGDRADDEHTEAPGPHRVRRCSAVQRLRRDDVRIGAVESERPARVGARRAKIATRDGGKARVDEGRAARLRR